MIYPHDTYETPPFSQAQPANARVLFVDTETYSGKTIDEIKKAFSAEDKERRAANTFLIRVRALWRNKPWGAP